MPVLVSETMLRSYINSLVEGTEKRQPDCCFQAQLLGGTTACSRVENSDADGSSAISCTRLEQTPSS